MSDFELNEHQVNLQSRARDFALQQIRPLAMELDSRRSHTFDWEIVRRLARHGFLAFTVPTEYGGGGLGSVDAFIVFEELAFGCAGVASLAMASNLAVTALLLGGDEAQRQHFLPPLCAAKGALAAFALTEPEAGSDIANVATVAERGGEGYVLQGKKCLITNVGLANWYLVFASIGCRRGSGGIGAFLVAGDAPGLRPGALEDKLGLRAAPTGDVLLDGVTLSKADLLAAEGAGFLLAIQTLDRTRPIAAAVAIGTARAGYEDALEHAKGRRQFGRALVDNQAIAFRLVDMATNLDAARLLTYRACRLIDRDEDYGKAAAMAKLFATEMAVGVTRDALHIFGGHGYTRRHRVEKYLRDAQIMPLYEGSSEILRTIISSQL